MRLRP